MGKKFKPNLDLTNAKVIYHGVIPGSPGSDDPFNELFLYETVNKRGVAFLVTRETLFKGNSAMTEWMSINKLEKELSRYRKRENDPYSKNKAEFYQEAQDAWHNHKKSALLDIQDFVMAKEEIIDKVEETFKKK